MTNRGRKYIMPAAFVLLGGCISLSPDIPPSLMTLSPQAEAPAGTEVTASNAIAVDVPDVPASLDVLRVPVQVTDSEIAYLKDAQWVEKPAQLFTRLLAETIRVRNSTMAVDGGDPTLKIDSRLGGVLRQFGYDARSNSVIVRYDAILRGKGGSFEARRFEAVIPGVTAEAGPVSMALNDAANDVAAQIADWIKTR
ncbi:MAG: ABC-type transport auxiliary lipoprotein family protein [Sphingomonadaceae bacterium]